MTQTEIEAMLPHRKPMLLVDDMWLDGEYGMSTYKVKGDEAFLNGHFPGNPVVPGVILCEIMGQGSSILIKSLLDGTVYPVFVGFDKVRFKRMAKPGDTILTKSKITDSKGNIIFVETTSTIEGEICCSAKLTVALVKKD